MEGHNHNDTVCMHGVIGWEIVNIYGQMSVHLQNTADFAITFASTRELPQEKL